MIRIEPRDQRFSILVDLSDDHAGALKLWLKMEGWLLANVGHRDEVVNGAGSWRADLLENHVLDVRIDNHEKAAEFKLRFG